MENPGRYHHLRVDWVGESSTPAITQCGVGGEEVRTGPTLCPDCASVEEALNAPTILSAPETHPDPADTRNIALGACRE